MANVLYKKETLQDLESFLKKSSKGWRGEQEITKRALCYIMKLFHPEIIVETNFYLSFEEIMSICKPKWEALPFKERYYLLKKWFPNHKYFFPGFPFQEN